MELVSIPITVYIKLDKQKATGTGLIKMKLNMSFEKETILKARRGGDKNWNDMKQIIVQEFRTVHQLPDLFRITDWSMPFFDNDLFSAAAV